MVTGAKADHRESCATKTGSRLLHQSSTQREQPHLEGVSYSFASVGTKAGATNARRLHSGATLRARTDMDADDRFAVVLHGVETVFAE
jgi:hypothetical protein